MTYCGCDNGISGALVVLSDMAGVAPVAMTLMPIRAKQKGNEVDPELLWMWLEQFTHQDLTVVVEKPAGAQNASAAVSMADSFACIRTILELKGIRRHYINAKTWQKVMLPNCPTGNTKPFALTVAQRIWPEEKWLGTPMAKGPNGNLVDAALIAEFARRERL